MKNGKQNGRAENGRYEKGSNGGAHGKPGRSGRKPNEVKRLAIEYSDEVLIPMLATIAEDKNYRPMERIAAAKIVLEYNKPKPAQIIEHSGQVQVNVSELQQEFTGRMARLAARLGAQGIPGLTN